MKHSLYLLPSPRAFCMLLCCLAWATFGFQRVAAEDERPNVVLFIADDVSASDFGCYGHPTIETPNIDRLARGGLRFENAYLTTSSCSPTRTSLITGRYPHNTGAPELHMGDAPYLADLPQFPHELRKAGYYTAQAGKWHFNGDASKSFDRREGGGPSGAEMWVPVLAERPKDRPFFMWFAAYDAHRQWDQPLSEGPHGPEDVVVPPYLIDGDETRKDLAHYYNEVHRFDRFVGEVVDELKRQGVYQNTLLIVMADNGRPFPRDKTWCYDSGIKTPLVVHWPRKIKAPAVSRSLVSIIDLAPTILELAGAEVPESFQGVSLARVFEDPNHAARDFVFAERNWHTQRYLERMVRFGSYTYIRNFIPECVGFSFVHYGKMNQPAYLQLVEEARHGNLNAAQSNVLAKPRPAEQLYDLREDPLQLRNLAKDPAYQGVLDRLRIILSQWREETGDTAPPFEELTPDRNSRATWKPIWPSGRPEGGKVPGHDTQAWTINDPGPIRLADVFGAKGGEY